MAEHSYLWLDLETTGLDPARCRILEWAAVLAADDRDGDMTPLEQYTGVVGVFDDAPQAWAEMDTYVRGMHERNGLFAECMQSPHTLADAEDALVEICTLLGAKPRSVVLAGSTVHFDLGFVRMHMPRFAEYLSHRCFDVSTLKMAERDWAGESFAKAEAHRALPDVLESLAQAAEIRARIGRWA